MRWSDHRLSWTPSSYDNIPVIQVMSSDIWTPALVVDNSIDDLSAIDEDSIPLRIDNSGTVSWNPPGLLTVSCNMDISYFPWDQHTCAIQVTSFGYTVQELDIKVYGSGVDITYFNPDGEWVLEENWTNRTTFTGDNYQYTKIYYYFKMTRRPLYYGLNYLLPVLITSFLIIFVFVLPAECGEKIGYCLTVMLGYMVILTLIAADLPTTAQYTSILELYIAVVLIMGGLSVVFSIYVLELYHRPDDRPIPLYIRRLTLLGMRICCFENSCCSPRVEPTAHPLNNAEANGVQWQPPLPPHSTEMNSLRQRRGSAQNSSAPPGTKLFKPVTYHGVADPLGSGKNNPDKHFESDNHIMLKQPNSREQSFLGLRPATVQSTPEEQSRGTEISWQTVSMVLDAILLRFYILFLVISSVVFITILVVN
ncbi:neuronal acetylcholine receptor subunit alpha-3-like [Physella acuta]|uniref:neuronal acetylcholine receptor subunit alpha-3-like n=1 Tax=Physella acuta TaxID=109671 RepID=UPI0027DC1600|nr:neuronal acetylcholine receptor subunit alpha-3-like [Physella acuta]